jgi:hypothetical protein
VLGSNRKSRIQSKRPHIKKPVKMLKNSMSLELIYRDPNPEFLTLGGVTIGAALHIVGDIEHWVKMCKGDETEE